MKIAMIGSGAAGSVFAAYLKRGGAELWLVDRYKAHMEKTSEQGLLFHCMGEDTVLRGFHTAESAAGLGVMDYVILMVKATQTASVMPGLTDCIGENTVVVSLQNGLGNEERIAAFVPKERILCGFGKIGTVLNAPGECTSMPEDGIVMHFGPFTEDPLLEARGRALADCFNAGGCPTRYETDIRPHIWKKAISNSGYNTLSAVLGLRVGELLTSPHARSLVLDIWREGSAVAQAAGAGDLYPELEADLENLLERFAAYYPSMAQDLQKGRATEISVLNGAIEVIGARYGVPTPLNSALVKMISALETAQAK